MALPLDLYSIAQVRAQDAHAIEQLGIPAYTLMKRAGEGALHVLRSRWPTAMQIVVVTGGGNNGGDGYVLARFARAVGLSVSVLAVVPPAELRGAARQASDDYLGGGGDLQGFAPELLRGGEVVIDALLGTGARAPQAGPIQSAVVAINECGLPVLALDLPSGLNGDTGAVLGSAVRADCTISFVGLKVGLYVGEGPELAGRIVFDDLGLQPPALDQQRPVLQRLQDSLIGQALPRRARAAHKGDFGHVLIIGGQPGMPGAVRLAGEAALRAGAGRVTVATAPENLVAVAAGRPELMLLRVSVGSALRAAVAAADVVAIGPGLGQSNWSRELLDVALQSGRPLVIDADALNLLAQSGQRPPPGSILTPHPGEAARLLGWSTTQLQQDRCEALRQLVQRCGGIVVLKGAGTLVGCESQVSAICERGNPGMAGPGMGDVLTGAIAGILGQCRDPWLAARVGVLVHAMAGDELARTVGGRGMLAGEVAEELTRWVNLAP